MTYARIRNSMTFHQFVSLVTIGSEGEADTVFVFLILIAVAFGSKNEIFPSESKTNSNG